MRIALGVLLVAALGCAASSDRDTSSGEGGGSGAQGGGGSGAHGGGGASQGGGGSGAAGGAGGGTAAAIVPSLVENGLYVNCQPIIAPDPVIGSFTATYDNSAGDGPGSATVTNASLSFDAGQLIWTFIVMPSSSNTVQPGASVNITHNKVADSGMGRGGPCGFCDGTWELTVQWDVDGQVVVESLPMEPVSCVF
jgi:hypothetical protein